MRSMVFSEKKEFKNELMVGPIIKCILVLVLLLKPLRFGNKKGFAVPHNGIIFSENSEKISSH